jgi:pimeloyl-ACP methyl ester carboxylesterase
MTENILAIHGAFSSPRIFNFIRFKSKGYKWHFFDYANETAGIVDLIKSVNSVESAHVVGHSMGGLIALGIASQPWVKTISTIATPLGGLDINLIQSYLSRSQFVNEIASHSEFIGNLKQLSVGKPVQHLISCQGFSPWMYEPNDGVVTLRSQKAPSFGQAHEIQANHAEIMLDNETVQKLQEFWRIHR